MLTDELKTALEKLAELNEKFAANTIPDGLFLRKILTPNFRTFHQNGIALDSPVTVLVGKNGTGKTTLLYLAACAFAPPMDAAQKRTRGKTFSDFIPETKKDLVPVGSQYGFEYTDKQKNSFKWIERKSGGKRVGTREWDRREKADRATKNTVFWGVERNLPNSIQILKFLGSGCVKEAEDAIGHIGDGVTALAEKIVKDIRHISGKDYKAIGKREGPFSGVSENSPGYLITGNQEEYSDIAAGSGEISIIRLVHQIETQPENTLFLIDEPETGIHPSALSKILAFIIRKVQEKKHQFIFTTHSDAIISYLNPESIILLESKDGKILSRHTNSVEAYKEISDRASPKLEIVVEDGLAKRIAERIIGKNGLFKDQVIVSIAQDEGYQAMIQRDAVRRHNAWELNSKMGTIPRPIFLFDADVKAELEKNKAEREKWGNPLTVKSELERGESALNKISESFGLSKKRLYFLTIYSIPFKEKKSLSEKIAVFCGYFGSNHFYFPGKYPPEKEVLLWLKDSWKTTKDELLPFLKDAADATAQDIFKKINEGIDRTATKKIFNEVLGLFNLENPDDVLISFWLKFQKDNPEIKAFLNSIKGFLKTK